jgi:hypothetical protein
VERGAVVRNFLPEEVIILWWFWVESWWEGWEEGKVLDKLTTYGFPGKLIFSLIISSYEYYNIKRKRPNNIGTIGKL